MSKRMSTTEICEKVAEEVKDWEFVTTTSEGKVWSYLFRKGDQEFEFHKRGDGMSNYKLKGREVATTWSEIGGPNPWKIACSVGDVLRAEIKKALKAFDRKRIARYLVNSVREQVRRGEENVTVAKAELARLESDFAADL